MKLEVNSQISKHEVKPIFIGSYTAKVSKNSGYYASVLGFLYFSGTKKGFCLREANCDTCDDKIWHT